MKTCGKCAETKPAEAFYRKHDSRDGRMSSCKDCSKADGAARYAADKRRVVERNAARRKRIAVEVDQIKAAPCADCGERYESVCMDFDHRDGEVKIDAVARLVHNHWSLRRIKEEIAKCDLVCVLCHKTRTHRRLQARQDKRPLGKAQVRNIAILIAAKDRPCAVCGCQRHPWQMEFDHIDTEVKRDNVTTLAWSRSAASVVEAEVSKCRVLCSLCHRRETALREGWRSETKGAAFTLRKPKPGHREGITVDQVRQIRQLVAAGVKPKKAHAKVCPQVKWGTAYAACYRGFIDAGPIPTPPLPTGTRPCSRCGGSAESYSRVCSPCWRAMNPEERELVPHCTFPGCRNRQDYKSGFCGGHQRQRSLGVNLHPLRGAR